MYVYICLRVCIHFDAHICLSLSLSLARSLHVSKKRWNSGLSSDTI